MVISIQNILLSDVKDNGQQVTYLYPPSNKSFIVCNSVVPLIIPYSPGVTITLVIYSRVTIEAINFSKTI